MKEKKKVKNNKKKKKGNSFSIILKCFIFVLLIAVIMLARQYFKMEMLEFAIMSICVIATYFIILVIVSEVRILKWKKRCENALNIILNETKVDKYIREMEDIYNNCNEKSLSDYIVTNLSAGYSCKGNYERANEYLKEINPKTLKEINLAGYYGNIIENYFRMGYVDEARKLLNQKGALLKLYINNNSCGSVINLCYALDCLTAGNFKEGRTYLEKAQALCNLDFMLNIIRMDFAKLYVAEGNIAKAEEEMQRLSKTNIVPCIRIEIDKLKKFISAEF